MVLKAIDILKMRWPEVMLVVVLQAGLMIFSDELVMMSQTMGPNQNTQIPFWAAFLMGLGSILCVIIWMMLYLGFLKTAAATGIYPRQPMELLRWGRPYFWRLFFFQLLFGFVLLIFSTLVIGVLGALIWKTEDVTRIPTWVSQIGFLAAVIFLLKPLLFIPARIVVFNDSIVKAFLAVRQYRMNDIKHLYWLIAGGFAAIGLFMFLSGLAEAKTPMYYIVTGMHHLVFSFVFLWLTLAAVLWVQADIESEQARANEEILQK